VIHQRPGFAIPFEAVSACREVAAVKKHPDQAVVFKFVGKWLGGLEKLIAVVDPSLFDDTANSEDNRGLPEIFISNQKTACATISRGQ
jgi:hypothetical protein